MKKICLLLAVWISFYGNNSFAQIVTPKIDTLNNVIVSQKKTVEEIFKEVEVLKLLEIQKKIKEIALPTPIQGEEIVNHSQYDENYHPDEDAHDYNYQEKYRVDPFYFVIEPTNLEKDQRTTLMIKNIPNKYTIEYLAEEIDR